ncbi:MAG: hypothetical protein WDM87_10750 [Terracidiphilus sp.]
MAYYSPIVGSIANGFSARPEYYGLILAQEFAGAYAEEDHTRNAGNERYSLRGRRRGGAAPGCRF